MQGRGREQQQTCDEQNDGGRQDGAEGLDHRADAIFQAGSILPGWVRHPECSCRRGIATVLREGAALLLKSLRLPDFAMLAKRAPGNRLILPAAVLASFPETECFDVVEEDGRIVLTPVRLRRADEVRSKLADLGITEEDSAAAVSWARSKT